MHHQAAPFNAFTAGTAVLVADDDAAIRRLVARVLTREQFDVSEAQHGAQAIECLRSRHFAVLVLDLMMPVATGYDVIAWLDSHPDAGDPCVIVISAAGDRELAQLKSQSVHNVLQKPFELRELVTAVQECRRRHGAAAR